MRGKHVPGLIALFIAVLADPIAPAAIVWMNPANSNWTTIPGGAQTDPPANLEVADDFTVYGPVERIVVHGYNPCLGPCFPPPVAGVYVRFYESTPNGPGTLLQEYFLAGNDPAFTYDPQSPDEFDIRLPSPFAANGPTFVSVQPEFDGAFYWGWWVSSHGNATGAPLWHRDNLGAGTWQPFTDILGNQLNDDVAFILYGTPGGKTPGACGSWSVSPTPEPPASTRSLLRDISALSADDIWAVGEYMELVDGNFVSKTLAMHYDGGWSVVPSPSPSPYPSGTWATLDAVAAVNSNEVWAAGGARVQATDGFVGTHLLITRWNGSSWSVVNGLPQAPGASGENIRDIVVVAPDDIWFLGDWVNPQTGLALHWNGSSFSRVPMPLVSNAGHGIEAGAAIAPDDIWAVGGGGDGDWTDFSNIFHWNGSAWSHVPGPTPGILQRLWDVHAFATDDVWACGVYQDGSEILPLIIHWDGASWTQFATPAGGSALVPFAPDNMLSIGGGAARWDGIAWQLESSAGLEDVLFPSLISAAVLDTCDVWAVGREVVGGDIRSLAAHLTGLQLGFRSDMNCDGALTVADIAAFVRALTDPAAFGAAYPGCDINNADVNGDGGVSTGDIGLFVQMLTAQ